MVRVAISGHRPEIISHLVGRVQECETMGSERGEQPRVQGEPL